MKRITVGLMSTTAALVLLSACGGTDSESGDATGTTGSDTSTSSGVTTGTEASASSGATSSGGTSVASGGSSGSGTYKGSVVQTRWGAIQVTITVSNGKIASVAVPTYPNENGKDKEINAYALPILKKATLSAQSANIDSVSGATVTSEGYKQSLQSAIDAAHLS